MQRISTRFISNKVLKATLVIPILIFMSFLAYGQVVSNADQSLSCKMLDGSSCTAGVAGCLCVGYDECAPLYGLNGTYVSPVGQGCVDTCNTECGKFSALNNGVELNGDLISICKFMCRNQNQFTAFRRLPSLRGFSSSSDFVAQTHCTPDYRVYYWWRACQLYEATSTVFAYNYNSMFYNFDTSETSTSNACTSSNINTSYNSFIVARKGGVMTVTVKQVDPTIPNEIMLCGHDIRQRDADIYPMNPTTNGTAIDDWSGITWSVDDRHVFHAKNHAPYNFRLFIRDGDYLNITYYGNERNGTNALLARKPDLSTQTNPQGAYGDNSAWLSTSSNQYETIQGSNWYGLQYNALGSIKLPGQNDTSTIKQYVGTLSGLAPNGFALFGVQHGDAIDVSRWDDYTYGSCRCDAPGYDLAAVFGCYRCRGSGYYKDNWGGFFVNIERKGCVYTNGQKLQYAVGAPTGDGVTYYQPDPTNNSLWTDINFTQNGSNYVATIPMTTDGMIYYRISRLSPPSASSSNVWDCSSVNDACNQMIPATELAMMYNNVEGQYYIETTINNTGGIGQ